MSDSVTPVEPVAQENSGTDPIIAPVEKKDHVAYDTYKRTVGEAKKAKDETRALREQLEAFQEQEKIRTDKELADSNNWQKMVEIRDAELKKANDELINVRGSVMQALKRDAFLQALQGEVPKEYHSLIPMDQIIYDPNNGGIDEMSLTTAVEEFRKVHHRVIDSKNVSRLPNTIPTGSGRSVTDPKAQFDTLSAKDRQAALAKDLVNLKG